MNFLTTLNFDKHKIEKNWKIEWFLDVSNSTLLLKKIEDEIIMRNHIHRNHITL
jgi:hypothetical protein